MPKWISVGRTDVHESVVQSYIREGGEVADLLNDVSRDVKRYSVGYISAGHVRSGRLLRGLWWNRTKAEGPLQGFSQAGSSARHTLYFHDGTAGNGAGFIRGRPYMVVPKNRRAAHTNPAFSGAGSQTLNRNAGKKFKGVKREEYVRGQRAKPFLQQGLAVSLAKQGLK